MLMVMSSKSNDKLVWWVIPGFLAGMPMPVVHADRLVARRGQLTAFDDHLPVLFSAGVRSIVSLVEEPTDASVYESAGFGFLSLPIPDGGAPTLAQAEAFVRFVTEQRRAGRPVAVYCALGLGRTGTMLAIYLVSQGETPSQAVARVRAVERFAIQTGRQVRFLKEYADQLQPRKG